MACWRFFAEPNTIVFDELHPAVGIRMVKAVCIVQFAGHHPPAISDRLLRSRVRRPYDSAFRGKL